MTPVNIDSMKKHNLWNTDNFERVRREVVKEVSQYMLLAIQKAVAGDQVYKLSVVDKPGPETLVIDLALVEVVPAMGWLHTSASKLGQSRLHHSMAIEGRVREGETGRMIGLFSDWQVNHQKLGNMADPAWSNHIHDIMDKWANQISALLCSRKNEKNIPFFYFESIGKAFADMLSKLSSVPHLGLHSQ